MRGAGLCFAECRSFQNLTEFDKSISSRPAPFGGGGLTIPSGITAAPSKFGLSVCGRAFLGLRPGFPGVGRNISGVILMVRDAMLGGYAVLLGLGRGILQILEGCQEPT